MTLSPSHLSGAAAPLALAIGQFDGVHLGHQAVFHATVAAARERNGIAGCLTFHPHVAAVLDPAHAPPLLATPAQNQALITACGIGPIHTLPFTRSLAAMTPAEFLALLKMKFPPLTDIVVGQNFTFGKSRAGNAATLPALAESVGLQARIVTHVEVDGAPISSTRIRAAVLGGDLPLARTLLGHSFALAGHVVRGRAVGRTLGFPTANIQPILPIRPAPGIYAARLHLHDGPHPGAAFVPDPADPRQAHFGSVVEIHLPGFDRNLYDHDVEIAFTRRLRGHMTFPDPAAASAQIARDSRQALDVEAQDTP